MTLLLDFKNPITKEFWQRRQGASWKERNLTAAFRFKLSKVEAGLGTIVRADFSQTTEPQNRTDRLGYARKKNHSKASDFALNY